MAVFILYYSIIIPFQNLKRVLTEDELSKILRLPNKYYDKICFDDYLYKEGSMSPLDNELIIKKWEEKGLLPTEQRNGQTYWKDLCLLEMMNDQPVTYPCDWIEIIEQPGNDHDTFANLKGKPVVFPDMPKYNKK